MNNRLIYPILLISALIIVSGCATPARMTQMKAEPNSWTKAHTTTPLINSISIKHVDGGKETNRIGKSQIGNEAFKDALTISLLDAELLAAGSNGAYALEAKIINVEQPTFGLNLTAVTNIQYTLTRVEDSNEIFSETIEAPYTAQFTDSLVGHARLKLANEGSVRNNIAQLIEKLYQLNIKPKTIAVALAN